MAECGVCFHHCVIPEGKTGFCGARKCVNDKILPSNYGRITSLALDPIEKKPLRRFHPGSMILSAGSFGCNLRCPFCQNHEISMLRDPKDIESVTPDELVRCAVKYKSRGNIGIAFTYNEPLIGWEFVRDTAKISHEADLVNVLVTNGTAELSVLDELRPYIDAMNIDLKGFTARYYSDVLGGDLEQVKAFIASAVKSCHVELTVLIVPGENDSENEMRDMSGWIADLTDTGGKTIGEDIPLHVSRFFPRYRMTDRRATDIDLIYRLAGIANEKLKYVYTGNC